MTQFAFLTREWPEAAAAASRAEALASPDPRAACFYARRALELLVYWVYKGDSSLKLPYQDNLSALLHEPTFKKAVGEAVFSKTQIITRLGNQAVHSHKAVLATDSLVAVRELFHVAFWVARTYGRVGRPAAGLKFDSAALPKTTPIPRQTLEQLQKLEAELQARNEKLAALLADKNALDAELRQLRVEVAEAKRIAEQQADTHDYSEAATRDYFIDLLLKEAGWPLADKRDREFEVAGMPNDQGKGFVDYVLWGDDGKPLGVVEAKRTKRDPRAGRQQAKLYADCLETQFGQRPLIFYTNGYEHWYWDDVRYPPRAVQGFLKKDEMQLAIQRRTSRKALATADVDGRIVERPYQTRAIRRIAETFEKDNQRKALIVMATGAGKTRTVIALCDLLMRCNWIKRVLFLADRVALVKQAVNAFKAHLPSSAAVNLVTEKETEGRVFVSTYPTMMGLIDQSNDELRRFGVGHFDLVVIDEAHRSVYQKYGAIFDYFDSLLLGLTATPKDEVDRNTYRLFELETGVPTDAYDLDSAVRDRYLVPPRAVSVPLKFQRRGISYAELSEEEKEQWDALEWDEDGTPPPAIIEPAALNSWLFNKDTVDKVLELLMREGLNVAAGDRLGKTIVFAKNHDHAEFIAQRFDANYPHLKGHFARVIDFKVEYAQTLIDDFSATEKAPHIAISVDMLDTGIDVPDVVNLVFFKLVRSKTKFWQMIGRGTRLRPDLFGPGIHKEFFYVFDLCENLEFFNQQLPPAESSPGASLGKKLFTSRVELIAALDRRFFEQPMVAVEKPGTELALRRSTSERLRDEVAAMNLNNFIVRPKRKWVEKYSAATVWSKVGTGEQAELVHELAGLPSEYADEDQEAKQFDLIILRLQLAVLNHDTSFKRLSEQVRSIARLLEENSSIPMINAQLHLIQELQTDDFWSGVTTPILENVRKRIRELVKLIERRKRKIVYSDFEDEIGAGSAVALAGLTASTEFAKFRDKARQFLRGKEDAVPIRKLRRNEPMTADDIAELERMLVDAGIGSSDDILRAREESRGLDAFVRSLVGLDREAAKQLFGGFLTGRALNGDQIEFMDLIINYLTQHGTMEAALLYESPFTDYSPLGVEGVFGKSDADVLVGILRGTAPSSH